MENKIYQVVMVGVALLMVGLLLPLGINSMVNANTSTTTIHSAPSENMGNGNGVKHTYTENSIYKPIYDNSLTVTATIENAENASRFYSKIFTCGHGVTITNNTTGAYSLETTTPVENNTSIIADYEYTITVSLNSSAKTVIVVLLPVLACIGIALLFMPDLKHRIFG